MNNICCRTRFYKEPGGMQIEEPNRGYMIRQYLTKVYPELCKLNVSKSHFIIYI